MDGTAVRYPGLQSGELQFANRHKISIKDCENNSFINIYKTSNSIIDFRKIDENGILILEIPNNDLNTAVINIYDLKTKKISNIGSVKINKYERVKISDISPGGIYCLILTSDNSRSYLFNITSKKLEKLSFDLPVLHNTYFYFLDDSNVIVSNSTHYKSLFVNTLYYNLNLDNGIKKLFIINLDLIFTRNIQSIEI